MPSFYVARGRRPVVIVLVLAVEGCLMRSNGGCQTPCLVISACAVAETAVYALASTPPSYVCNFSHSNNCSRDCASLSLEGCARRRDMKGLILVGGLGTQLRPLTLSTPKPLIEFGNKPQLLHFIDALVEAGVTEVVLAITYRQEIMQGFLDKYQAQYGIKITCSQEREPLGTAGPLALAKELLNDGEPFFVMNCDIACACNLRDLLQFHRAHGKIGTILVTRVDEPSKYGKSVVLCHETGLIDRFVEHGRTFAGTLINAGVYVFSPEIFDRLEMRVTSMEKEVLPALASEGQLYSRNLDEKGFWMNVKKPRDFLQGSGLFLRYLQEQKPSQLAEQPQGVTIQQPCLVHPSATIAAGCHIGPSVTIGPGCVVEEGARLSNCVLLDGVRVCAHAVVMESLIGWRSSIGSWTRVEGVSVLGESVSVGPELCLNGALILPHKSISDSVTEPQIIM